MPIVRSTVALLVALVALVALAACGPDVGERAGGQAAEPGTEKKREHEPDPPPDTSNDPTSVPQPEERRTDRDRGPNAGSILDEGFGDAIRATEAEDRFTFYSKVTIDLGAAPMEIYRSGALDTSGAPRLSVGVGSGDTTEQVRIDGDDAWYLSTRPEFAGAVPAGTEWIHVTGQEDIAADAEATRRDLTGPLSFLSGADDIEHTGSSSVDGEGVETYSFTKRLGPEDGFQGVLGDDVVVDVTGEVDIDAHGRVRGIRASGDIKSGDEIAGQVDIDIEYGNFDTAIDVQPPPDDVTVDAAGDPDLLALAADQIG